MNSMETQIFNQVLKIPEGWYWLSPSKKIICGKIQAVNLMGRELVVYRGQNLEVVALDAYCPHMGAHLAEGKIEGNDIRCFFHNWRFNPQGQCIEIPCLTQIPANGILIKSWHLTERFGMIWIWLGQGQPADELPEIPALNGQQVVAALGNTFQKNCHPNVVMVNAIDEQHFHTVHKLPGSVLQMKPEIKDSFNISFHNQGFIPNTNWFSRLISRFYQGPLTYSLSYWYGHLGTVTFGPDFLQLHLMFALRQTAEGKTEGQTIVFTKYRHGIWGRFCNSLILFLTKLGGRYFARGDTRIFQTIRFDFQTPIAADRTVIAFIKHLESQTLVQWINPKEITCKKQS